MFGVWAALQNIIAQDRAFQAQITYYENLSLRHQYQQSLNVIQSIKLEPPLGWAYWYAIGDEGCI